MPHEVYVSEEDRFQEALLMRDNELSRLFADLKAAQVENERLLLAVKTARLFVSMMSAGVMEEMRDVWGNTNTNLYIARQSVAYNAIEEVLQPRCPVCNGYGVVSIHNGDDSTACPACGDKPMSDEELLEEVCSK